jgi:Ni,Fe-hydrogenase I cytochrome b subunit
MIEDWEIGDLYWNCLRSANGDEQIAVQKVKEKYWDDIAQKRDTYLFLGTTKENQLRAPNPFIIIGVFYPPYPPKNDAPDLFGDEL